MDFESVLEAAGVLTTILYLWDRIRDFRSFVHKHPPSQYAQGDRVGAWRWADPPPGVELQILDTVDFSRVILPDARNTGQMVALVAACGLLLLGIGMTIDVLVLSSDRGHIVDKLFLPALVLLFGGALLDYDCRLIAIDLREDRVVFVLRYGVYLTRNITMKVGRVRSFTGKVQSVLTVERDQPTPHFYLHARRFLLAREFVTDCNPSQGTWVVGGLEHWRAAVGARPGSK